MPPFLLLLKALADEGRLQVLHLLLSRDLCVGGLARELGTSEPAVSQHLKKLREAGLVIGEKRGYWTHYVVNKEALHYMRNELSELAATQRQVQGSCARKDATCSCCCSTSKTESLFEDFRGKKEKGDASE